MSNYKYPKPTVGQTVWIKPTSSNSRRGKFYLEESKVVKVGKQYFYVEISGYFAPLKFSLDNWVQDNGKYTADWVAYERLQQINDEKEAEQLLSSIVASFRMYNAKFSLDQLRRIKQILDEQ